MKNNSILVLLLLITGCTTTSSNHISTSPVSSSSLSSTISSSTSSYVHEPVQYIQVEANPIENDPYEGVSKNDFYSNYREATSYEDALLRTQHGLISGSITYLDTLHESNTIYSGREFLKFDNYTYGINEKNEIISYNINTKEGTYKTIYKGARI